MLPNGDAMITPNDTAQDIIEIVGERLKLARLNKNMKQEDLAALTGLSRKVIVAAEKGRLTVETLASIMIALGKSQSFDALLPEVPPSPMQMLKLKGKERRRATGNFKKGTTKGAW